MLNETEVKAAKRRVLEALSSADGQSSFAVGVTLPDPDAGFSGFRVAVRLKDDAEKEEAQQKIAHAGGVAAADVDFGLGPIPHVTPAPIAMPAVQKLAIGMSVSHIAGNAGSIGFFAKLGEVKGFVSCNHVIARADNFLPDDKILAPARDDANGNTQLAGTLLRVARFQSDHFKYADAAFARAEMDRWPDRPGYLGADGMLTTELASIRRGMNVAKIGRTTQRSIGKVTACWIDWFHIDFGGPPIRLHDVIEIAGIDQDGHITDQDGAPIAFCDEGDSGSLVYELGENGINRPLGLLFGKSTERSFANPIRRVMHALGDIEMVV